jgi:hypothetical protein
MPEQQGHERAATRAARGQLNGAGVSHVETALTEDWTVLEEITDELEDEGAFGFGPNEHSRAWIVTSPLGVPVEIRRLGSTSAIADWHAAPTNRLQAVRVFRVDVSDAGSGRTGGAWFVAVEPPLASPEAARESAAAPVDGHNRLLNSAMDPDTAELAPVDGINSVAALVDLLANATSPNEVLLADDDWALAGDGGASLDRRHADRS